MHGPASDPEKRSRNAYPSPVVREMSSRTGTSGRVDRVLLVSEREGLDRHPKLDPTALARGEAKRPQIEQISLQGHDPEGSEHLPGSAAAPAPA